MTMNSDPPATKFVDSDALARNLSDQLAANLRIAIAARGLASLVVSGGKSPIKLFELLRVETLDWSRVCIALADERWVDPTDPESNEKLVRDYLLKESAAAARFIGLKNAAPTPDLGAVSA
jgi:6-phosphogluconolactonase